jgi:chitin disaccharide deacetylase
MTIPPGATRSVVLHADDFGMNPAVNAGILQSLREGVLTSTSLLANAPAAEDACAEWQVLEADRRAGGLPSATRRAQLGDRVVPFDLGIHLNLTQGQPLSGDAYPSELLDGRGRFPGIGTVFRRLCIARRRFRSGVLRELRLQIEWMHDHGVRPTHLNGHQYVELVPGVAELIPELVQRYSIGSIRLAREPHLVRTVLAQGRLAPFAIALVKRHFANRLRRRLTSSRISFPAGFFGTAHAGLVDLPTLRRFMSCASPLGLTEIGLHPAAESTAMRRPPGDEWYDPLAVHRPRELSWLCDSAAADLIAACGMQLGRLNPFLG